MTKPAIKLFITDEGYRAIGHVAAQWAYLETEIDYLLSILLAQEEVKKLNLPNRQSFKSRIKNLKEAASVLLKDHKDDLDEINQILTDASSLRGFRDDIIHGLWKLKRKGGNIFPGVVAVTSFPSYKYKDIKFTYQKAEEVAVKISKVTLRVTDWRFKHVRDN